MFVFQFKAGPIGCAAEVLKMISEDVNLPKIEKDEFIAVLKGRRCFATSFTAVHRLIKFEIWETIHC